jgi:hypothetical protein
LAVEATVDDVVVGARVFDPKGTSHIGKDSRVDI